MNKKMKKAGALLAASTWLAFAPAVRAQPAGGELVQQDFEDNEAGWIKFGDAAQIGISREAENVHGGAAALQFNYTLRPRSIEAIALANPAPLAAANKISFWAKAATESTMAFAIQERGGGMWLALFELPEGKWQRVELTLADFSSGFAPGDKPDPDGKLSLESIEWAGIGDFAQFILQEPNSPLAKLFGIEPGPRTLWLDDIAFDPAKPAPPAEGEALTVDSFAAPQLSWVHLAGTDIAREEKAVGAAKMSGLSLSYTQATGKFSGVIRRVNPAAWSGATRISMRLASEAPAALGLQLEERGGGKYFVPVLVPGDGEVKEQSFGVAQFQPAQDSNDGNGHLDMDQVQQIMVLDLAALNPVAANTNNTLWIGDIRVAK